MAEPSLPLTSLSEASQKLLVHVETPCLWMGKSYVLAHPAYDRTLLVVFYAKACLTMG